MIVLTLDRFKLCKTAYLSDDVVDDLVDGETNIGVDGEHLSQRIFILCGVQVAIK